MAVSRMTRLGRALAAVRRGHSFSDRPRRPVARDTVRAARTRHRTRVRLATTPRTRETRLAPPPPRPHPVPPSPRPRRSSRVSIAPKSRHHDGNVHESGRHALDASHQGSSRVLRQRPSEARVPAAAAPPSGGAPTPRPRPQWTTHNVHSGCKAKPTGKP